MVTSCKFKIAQIFKSPNKAFEYLVCDSTTVPPITMCYLILKRHYLLYKKIIVSVFAVNNVGRIGPSSSLRSLISLLC